MSAADPQFIEHVVRAVLERLQQQGGTARGAGAVSPPAETAAAKPAAEIALAERVVTADVLERHRHPGSSGGSLRFRIPAGVLVTPAANDWLREHRAAITRDGAVSTQHSTASGSWAILVGTHSPVAATAVDDVTRRLRTHCLKAPCSNSTQAVEQAVSRICRGEQQGVVIITDRPALAACLANRQPAVRAAAVSGRQLEEAVLSGLDPNVLCLSPVERTFVELRNMLEQAVRRVPAPAGNPSRQ